ncbi:hypothetical protein [Campylobacter sp. RM16187]|uniref:hypothetical protein n=1 Tax=Campylobacter sp. RM16187 TaxID=1660063 RepID=UPI0021B4DFAF|nr:hypothetical protein [Campylobacter sp. RM16187]QKG30326.1 hypothetical protein CDOMF_b028 [Campylobacter sp. RM16187]
MQNDYSKYENLSKKKLLNLFLKAEDNYKKIEEKLKEQGELVEFLRKKSKEIISESSSSLNTKQVKKAKSLEQDC